MRFGIVGAGVIGKTHARLISGRGDARLVAVADTDESAATRLAGEFDCAAVSTVDELTKRDDVDAISVCVPSGMHADAAVAALDAGKHVVVEKPIDITLAAADRIIDAERRSGRTVTVISQRRFRPAYRQVNDLATAGRLGRITWGAAESTFWRPQSYYDSGGWRGTWALDGGGALMNQGIHALDLLVWMLGEPVEASAYAATLAHERIEVEDTLTASVRFAGGALGTVTATTAAYPGGSVRLTVAGDAGTAVIADERLASLHTRDGEAGTGPDDQAETSTGATGPGGVTEAHGAQYADFLAAVRDERPPRVTAADGRRALALVLAIYESARSGGRPTPVK